MDEFQVLFEIVKAFSSSNIRKEFNIQEFLHSYPSTLNNKRKKTINDYFIRYIKVLHDQ
jgi:hypothetical protein